MPRFIKKLSLRTKVIAGASLFLLLSYSLLFLIPKPVSYAYSDNACVDQVTVLPGIMKQTVGSDFVVAFKEGVSFAGVPLISFKTCFVAHAIPEQGDKVVKVSPFGMFIGVKHYQISVPEPPVAHVSDFIGKTLPLTRPINIGLTKVDEVFSYDLVINKKEAECEHKNSALLCDIEPLGLEPGKEYTAQLDRSFKDVKVATLAEGKIQILQALVRQNSSVNEGQVIYDKPTQFTFEYDKGLVDATAELKQRDGETLRPVPSKTTVKDKTIIVAPTGMLKRNSSFELTLKQAEAEDGSGLSGPVTIPFTMSGGPKVADISIGSSGVSQSQQAVVTFDQPLNGSVDVAKFVHITGVNGSVRKISENQVAVTLQNAPLCAAFSVVVDKGLPSGSNDETSAEGWKYDSRTVCGYSTVIGYSVRGRPIVAYYFGNGTDTILFTGGMHGSERSGQVTMQAWVTYLQTNGHKIPADKRVVIIPNTNPDGIATGSRNNVNNVNIDRNFPASNWSARIDTASGVLENGGGTSPGSEPETQAVLSITRQLRPRLEVSFHAQGSLVGANKYGDSVAIGNLYASMVGYGTMFNNPEEVMGYTITGEYEDWMGEELGVPAILIELPTPSGNYLNSQLNALLKMTTV